MTSIKLPVVKRFASKTKKVSPYEKFFLWVGKQMGGIPEGKLINVSAVCVHEPFAKDLDQLVKDWMFYVHKFDKWQIKREFAYLHLDISPACFYKKEPLYVSYPQGYAYIREDLFEVKHE